MPPSGGLASLAADAASPLPPHRAFGAPSLPHHSRPTGPPVTRRYVTTPAPQGLRLPVATSPLPAHRTFGEPSLRHHTRSARRRLHVPTSPLTKRETAEARRYVATLGPQGLRYPIPRSPLPKHEAFGGPALCHHRGPTEPSVARHCVTPRARLHRHTQSARRHMQSARRHMQSARRHMQSARRHMQSARRHSVATPNPRDDTPSPLPIRETSLRHDSSCRSSSVSSRTKSGLPWN
jgi:hypothetical protein